MLRLFKAATMIATLVFGNAAAESLSLEDYLDTVRSNHPFFVKEQMSVEIQRVRRDGFLGAQDWSLVSAPSFTHQEPLQRSPFDPERVDVLAVGAGVQRVFWGSGARVSPSTTPTASSIGWASGPALPMQVVQP